MINQLKIPYTICFCICENKVLLHYRYKVPNRHKWNGIGGKLEEGEDPVTSIYREVMEESGIDLNLANRVEYKGIVSWSKFIEEFNSYKGVYTFLAYFKDLPATINKEMEKGRIEWKSIDWIVSPDNTEVVDNVPQVLKHMLQSKKTFHYHCDYEKSILQKIDILDLSSEFKTNYV